MGDKGKGCKDFRPLSGLTGNNMMFLIKNLPNASAEYLALAERKKQRRAQRIADGLVSPRMKSKTACFGITRHSKGVR